MMIEAFMTSCGTSYSRTAVSQPRPKASFDWPPNILRAVRLVNNTAFLTCLGFSSNGCTRPDCLNIGWNIGPNRALQVVYFCRELCTRTMCLMIGSCRCPFCLSLGRDWDHAVLFVREDQRRQLRSDFRPNRRKSCSIPTSGFLRVRSVN